MPGHCARNSTICTFNKTADVLMLPPCLPVHGKALLSSMPCSTNILYLQYFMAIAADLNGRPCKPSVHSRYHLPLCSPPPLSPEQLEDIKASDYFLTVVSLMCRTSKCIATASDEDEEVEAATPTSGATPSSRHAAHHEHHHQTTSRQHRHHTPSPRHAAVAAAAEDDHMPGWVQACLQCGSTDTPLWRTGPAGPKTLCNACGVKFSRHQQKGKPGVKHHPSKKIKQSSSHQPGCNPGSTHS